MKAAALLAGALLLAAPTPAAADVIFDPADADELASVLAEAHAEQGVCYGWDVTVDNVGIRDQSVGSNFGAGLSVGSGSCQKSVEFIATITYTSESSESEDSASYSVSSLPADLSNTDLNALGIDFDGLTGEDPDVVIGKAVTALPLLAADKGLAKPLSATPDTATAPANAQLTDDPGSDWWRDRGGMLIWALVLMAASGVLIWAVLRMNRRRPAIVEALLPAAPADATPEPESTEDKTTTEPPSPSAPDELSTEDHAAETPADEPPAAKDSVEPPSADEEPGETDQARPAPPDQKDKE